MSETRPQAPKNGSTGNWSFWLRMNLERKFEVLSEKNEKVSDLFESPIRHKWLFPRKICSNTLKCGTNEFIKQIKST